MADRRQRATCIALLACAAGCSRAGASAAEAPPPVAFSHKLHAADNEIGCGVCHPYARHSPNAGLAPASTCVGCHKFVAKDKPDIQKLLAEFAAGRPLTWTRNHRVPDHVFFSHERHLAKGLDCKACHGDVAEMQLDRQVQPLEMGACMDCHREKQASTDCLTCHK
jgi:hypothetical protein